MLGLARYRHEMAVARARIAATPSRVTATRFGSVEYLTFGDGPPVLLAHGVVGGCDQAPFVAEAFIGRGFRIVAPSRFGYLRSTVPADS